MQTKVPPKTYDEFLQRLKEIKQMGYIKTHRAGPTGVGKTLEDLLGIRENNVPSPNAVMIELKSARKGSGRRVTLVTKAPLPRGANSTLVQSFGYESSQGGKVLHITLNPLGSWTTIRSRPALKINLRENKLERARYCLYQR